VTYRQLAVWSALAAACALSAPNADAHPSHAHFGVFVGGYFGPYYAPYYAPFYAPYGWGPYWYGPYAYGTYAPYAYAYVPSGEARVLVTPDKAEVYVDGYRAGKVDDFDGAFQRLHVSPGGHEITLYMPGYRTITQRVYFGDGSTVKIRETMVPLAPGEKSDPPPPPAPRRRARTPDPDPRN